jgi:predicted kinase
MTKVWIVTGPPGAGKTTYVNERRLAGDLVVDVDALYTAVSGLDWYDKPLSLLPFVLAARDALIDRLCQPSEVQQAWVITSEADVGKLARMRERLKAELIVIETNPQECLRRIANDARRSDNWGAWEELIDKWWRTYEHSKIIEGGDSVVF